MANLCAKLWTCSSIWSAIRKGEGVFKKDSKWILGSNSYLSLWYDKWMDKSPLWSLIIGLLNWGDEGILLREVVNLTGWNWQRISFSLPRQLILEIKAILIFPSTSNFGCISWALSLSGLFNLKEAYELASLEEGNAIFGLVGGEWLWKVATIPKTKYFLWQCIHQASLFVLLLLLG